MEETPRQLARRLRKMPLREFALELKELQGDPEFVKELEEMRRETI